MSRASCFGRIGAIEASETRAPIGYHRWPVGATNVAIASELAFASIRTLAKKLRDREFTSVELTEFFLARLETLGPRLNAVVTVLRTSALEEAARADRELAAGKDRGPLHGIPY